MPMIEVKPTDTIVSDGKFYCVNFTLPSFGSSTFYINASDGLHLASTAVIAGPQVHPFYGYGQLGQVQRVALFKNSNPFGGTPEETILTAKGISYTVYTASSFGVSLNGFDKVIIAGDQPYSFYSSSYFSSSSTRTWLENYVNNGGVVLIAGIGSSTSSLTLPFGFTAYSDTINVLEFNRSYGNHPIIDGVSIASLNAHVPLAYHRITGNKAGDIILARDAVNRNVRLLAASRGSGLFIISDVYAESAYVNGWNLRLLENMVTYTRKYPRLLTPANDTYLYSSVVNYTWTPINPSFGPITYTWQLSTSPTFSTLVDQQTGLVAGSGNLSVVYTMNFSSSYFYWRVRPEFGSYAAPWKLAFRLYETYNNFAPSFSQAQVSPTAGQPSSTVFNFSVVYTDKDNTAPNYMWLYINGSYWGTLTKQNTSDNNYADGCLYRYTTTISVAGTYTFYVQSSDGRYTIYTATLGFIVKTNTAPTLTSGQVSPASGPSTNSFTFTVTYTDADNDTPSYIRVVVDGSPHAMAKQNPGDTTYTDGCVYIFSDRFPVGTRYFYFTCSDGIVTATTATGNFTVTAVNNFAPMLLNPAVSPETGNTATNYNFTVEYRDADNNFPTIITISINGTVYTMQAANPADSDATDGKVYYYATTLSVVGQYVFQVNCSDGTYLANTGIINKPEVILLNTTPTLSSGQVFPLSGTPSQTFTFSVVYTDAENNNPFYVRVVVNGTQYAMLKQTPGDNTYTDGCLYIYSSTFPIGFYVFYFNCSDGLATGTTATSNFTVSIINNYAPMLLNPTVSPEIGYQTTSFNFSVVYLDSDNNLPAIITLTINGSSYIMQPTSPTDSDVTNGKGYFYITTLSDLGQYQFQVNVSDGFYLANTALINKPEVVLVNTPPTLGSGQVTPSSGTTSQIFSFSVVYTDADNNNPIYVHVVVDGVQYAMSKQNISDNTYTDGCSYGFSMNFLAGTRFYYFICSDSLDVATTAIANFNVTVVNNNAPMLLNPAVTPETGTQSTVFNFTIRYLDLDNNFPAIITITINGTLYMMQTSNAADTDARDGKDYYYATTLTSLGWYQFRVNCSDGIYAANTGLINKPQVVQGNTAPVLSSHQVIPASGTSTTNFTFSVIYTDAENDAPSYVRVIVDGDQHVMVKQNTADVTYSDGCIYVVSLVFTQGNHSFYFTCSDGLLTHTTSTGQFEVTATFIPPPTFIEQYGLLIGVLSAAVVGIAIVASVSSRKKKAKKTLAGKQLPRKTLPATTFPEKIPEKAFVGKAKGTTEVQQPMSAEALAELQKTEKEVVATMDVKACIVHKGPIKGANYSCPHCNTFYCINCAITLANNGEGCWSCGNKIELDDTIKIAGVKQPVMAEKAKFYCSSCAQYHEPEKPNFDAWESCPVCNNPMVYVKACPYCTQPIALSKEHYTLYRNKLMQCPNPDCHKNVMI
nr:hypothetical protein [Candidatus Sigynarchaeota archaeon]